MTSRHLLRPAIYGAFVGAPLLLLIFIFAQDQVSPERLFRDPLQQAREIFILAQKGDTSAWCCAHYLGALSNIGVMLWSAAAGLCALTALVLFLGRDGRLRPAYFLAAAAVTTLLSLDDSLMLHEVYQLDVVAGISVWSAAQAVGAVTLFALLLMIGERDGLGLALLALGCLLVSKAVDNVLPQGPAVIALEDAFKFMGIGAWLGFNMLRASVTLKPADAMANPPALTHPVLPVAASKTAGTGGSRFRTTTIPSAKRPAFRLPNEIGHRTREKLGS